MRTIVLKFAGPMQSWGTDSHFNVRHTDLYPSKSAVIGMVAAALGFKRDDERIGFLDSMHFSVRVDQPGRITKDYHTAHSTNGRKNTVYVTTRYYLEDAVFTVALGIDDLSQAEEILEGLHNPYFQLSMGRRSFPIPADFIVGVYDQKPLDVLKNIPWQAADWYKRMSKREIRLSVYTDDADAKGLTRIRKDRLLSLSPEGRKYSERIEKEISVYVRNDEYKEHDAFEALGGI